MFKLKDGRFKSDFHINGKRYQRTWNTTDIDVAKKCEKDLKVSLQAALLTPAQLGFNGLDWLLETPKENKPFLLSEAKDYMIERVWQFLEDNKNPPSRINTLIKIMGDIDISLITDEVLLNLKRRMLILGINGKRYKEKTFNHIMGTLKSTLDMLESTGAYEFANKPNFKKLFASIRETKRVCFTDEEIDSIARYFKGVFEKTQTLADKEMYEYFVINSNLGLRPSEYYELRVGDIDFDNATITISRAVKTHSTTMKVGVTKNASSRTLPLGGITLEFLRNICDRIKIALSLEKSEAMQLYLDEPEGSLKEVYYWVARGKYKGLDKSNYQNCKLNNLNHMMCEARWKQMSKALGFDKRSNAKEYTQYAVRHTVASRLVSLKKFSAHRLMQYLGHKNIQTSLKYVHLNTEDIRDGIGVGIC
ncbi:tyrosine-type recombinase/integrase [Campylobacter hyointestinalis]|uniref:tyrosine-type recombinase/integrase n=1 Tax=Campylobacter hyointestinalis TaxID=198 RepID=UPI000CE3E989|nr:tyrosine-type recombinase/integrase [Campylobacter hyointestinalis]PPB63560.1 hypothetical protein CDQ74_04070 [Campylobacter hyointestinalis subsp. hyointestinalis]